jgi:hypothetical protein
MKVKWDDTDVDREKVAGSFEYANEYLVCIKCEKFPY